MKFDQQKVNFANSDRVESIDSEFLTFRNSAQNNTGRSVFSQKIQIYRSLEKVQLQQENELVPARSFKKKNNLQSIRSQQKYQKKSFTPIKRTAEIYSKDDKEQKNRGIAQNATANQFQFKNQLLRKKIQKLVKHIKTEQKKQIALEKDICQIQKQIQDNQKQIQSQTVQIEQLQAIDDQNQSYLQKLVENYHDFQTKNNDLQQLVQRIQDSLQNLLDTSQQDSKIKMAQKLKQGLSRLQNLRNQVSNRCLRMQSQIQKMKDYIQQTDNLDISIRDTTYTRQTQNNSHFTC